MSGQLSRHRSVSMSSGQSSKGNGRLATLSELSASMPMPMPMPMPESLPLPVSVPEMSRDFDPCAATASMFLYAQGSAVVCAHHDTLKIERLFSRHTEEISLLAVDTVSERGAGRLVVSYDVGQTAIVWDCMTGDELARFASYENLTVAAWMRNGNVAFGNSQGNVILFEPTTSEHLSARTIDQIPITAIAPAADCRTYAIGFANGSLLIAALQPRFTILHNLTTSRGPSPIVTLAWHASSSRQKSDMLATQTNDGDLRVWSIAKSPSSNDKAKVVRVLRRTDNFQTGPNWLGWSKNGRIVQYSEGETSSWDVRTKHVTYESVPTLGQVRGLAVYGPGATLFTLGQSNTAQQFDLNSPCQLVANVQHPANLLPPSPPVSIEEQKNREASAPTEGEEFSSVPINIDISESDEDHMSPLARIAREMDQLETDGQVPERDDTLSPISSRSHASTTSRSSAGSRTQYRKHSSTVSRGMSDGTTMSMGSSFHSTREPSVVSSRDTQSISSMSSASNTSGRSRPGRGSRLRQEVLRSPDDGKVVDLFKFTKSRLSDIPYRHPKVSDNTPLTNNDLRRQMLSTIFGWDGEAEELIKDEMSRHPKGSPNGLLLAKWLGDIDTDIMAASSESMTSSDWMLLALSGIGGHASQTKVARAYVQRLLEKGDVHTAATIMIGMGDQNDAIEIYVSHKRYMEALILVSLVFPADWQRQAELIRKWGEWAVQHSQQQLAIRCFSCTGTEPSEPWVSPTAQAATFSQMQSMSIPEMLSPPLSPPGARGPQRSIAKTSALKLITSFGDKGGKSKFFGLGEDERTPIGGGVTPIAESALSPGGGDTAHTAFLRPGHRSAYHTPASARTATPGGFSRQRLPSIGETPSDVIPQRVLEPAKLPTPVDSGSEREKSDRLAFSHERKPSQPETMQLNSATYVPLNRAATASPMMQKSKQYKELNPLPSPSPESFSLTKQNARTRNGSRDRKPDGLQIQWPPMESIITGDYMSSPDLSVTSSRARTATSRCTAGSTASHTTMANRSPLTSERSYRSLGTASPVVTGRSLDQYISSLESAQHHANKQRRQASREGESNGRARSGSRKPKAREISEDRGRSAARYIKPAKRSPTSPIPMSPEDLRDLGAVGYGDESFPATRSRDPSQLRVKASKPSSRVRRTSPEALSYSQINTGSKPPSRVVSRNGSRQPSPDTRRLMLIDTSRGRSKGREGSTMRSPSSPVPMSPQTKFYQADDEDHEELKQVHLEQKRFRSRQRSNSRLRERGTSAIRDPSPDRRRRDRSSSRIRGERDSSKTRKETSPHPRQERPAHTRTVSDQIRGVPDHRFGDIKQIKDERTLKKEQAARDLEERRKSLVGRPSVPPIVHPEELAQLSPMNHRPSPSPEFARASSYPSPKTSTAQPTSRSQTSSPANIRTSPGSLEKTAERASMQLGLPATPRAMRHPKYDPGGQDIPHVPHIPERYDPAQPASWGSLNAITYNNAFANLAPLPKTTYQAAPRRLPPRSASAPIPEEPPSSPKALPAGLPLHPAFHVALPPSGRRKTQDPSTIGAPLLVPRKISPGESQPGTLGYETQNLRPAYASGVPGIMSGIDETLEASSQPLNPSNENLTPPPPPPPPAPPILKELQHLATPPPPPPAPLYRPNNANTNSMVSGVSQGSGVIEIVMDDDDDDDDDHDHDEQPINQPILDVPAAPQHFQRPAAISHHRGRSENDNSITSRFNRAAERLRSGSRGRNGASPNFDRTRSPPQAEQSPYESVPGLWSAGPNNRQAAPSPASQQQLTTERHPREVKAAMIMDGGMI
ncbi:WD g-beta repeat protein [Drepanopeziza brunnea f. sp. 'multigermtubi' MB_m1]|uniref:WD g-beta repeat protein n=1 Tax=Marssonina brunnea f. sp. multigermtubi (strain MB_m1) TaxID=1072389 RepID=K1WS96_MARBU|nr:WD g-beta repeat protein [Drepanopeziza brunnea f. sp. 'multigermtubi' MB_m1]EKD15242.1 WD g-beta repeat protein [Drepanopeziza brunnea f. sp. 'multigermtubi' MB_m1]